MDRTRTEDRPPDQGWQHDDEEHNRGQHEAEHEKEEHIQERTAPAGEIVYEAVYREGEHELQRKSRSLLFSGVAAGLSMGFSLVTEAFLNAYMPDTHWRPLVSKLGYSVGFLIVILGRQQLFTKNTLTVMLPLLKKKQGRMLANVARLWAVVFFGNMIGAFAFALFISKTPIFGSPMHGIIRDIGLADLHPDFMTAMLNAIFAGWLIALMIWLLPFAETARVGVIVALAYIIGICHFSHIIAGSIPTLYLLITGGMSVGDWFGRFFAPVCIGNIIGGVALVALGAHAEFVDESKS